MCGCQNLKNGPLHGNLREHLSPCRLSASGSWVMLEARDLQKEVDQVQLDQRVPGAAPGLRLLLKRMVSEAGQGQKVMQVQQVELACG